MIELITPDILERNARGTRYRWPVILSARRYEKVYTRLLGLRWAFQAIALNEKTYSATQAVACDAVDAIDGIGDVLKMRRRYSGVGREVPVDWSRRYVAWVEKAWPWVALGLASTVNGIVTAALWVPLLRAWWLTGSIATAILFVWAARRVSR